MAGEVGAVSYFNISFKDRFRMQLLEIRNHLLADDLHERGGVR